jgi:iron complex outermembrane receptor protein
VVRGFDGDRVLIMQDGIRSGTISSQSGDHGEPVDPNSVDKIEVVRGPATLLYGSNAIGGVVNVTSSHHQIHQHAHEGLSGYLTGIGGTADSRGGGAAGFEYGSKKWLLWGGGSGQRSGDYASPLGKVLNSAADIKRTQAGFGHYGDRAFLTFDYGISGGDYGIPFDSAEQDPEKVALKYRLQHVRFGTGIKNVGSLFDQFNLTLNYSDWNHKERGPSESDAARIVTHNEFFNKQFIYRGSFDQKKKGRWTGTMGFWGMRRDYKAVGDEAITPPTKQDGIAAFALEQVSFERFRLQFGGRLESNRYSPLGLMNRSFTGFSGSAGINLPLWKGGAFVTNYTHSYRAPALEELYAFGPHAGNLTWEIGDINLKRERGDGIDFSLRHQSGKVQAEANYYYYNLLDYVYLAPTGVARDGLVEARYSQANSRYRGFEGRLGYHVAPAVSVHLGIDSVNAELKDPKTPLPRIPPLRGRTSVEWRYKDFSVEPELVLANRQDRVFPTETETAGYATFSLRASYTLTRQHWLQLFAVNLYNGGDRLYRNHLSFIKEFAPEIGRGVEFTYTIRFF